MSAGFQLAVLCGLSLVLITLGVWIVLQVRGTPEKRERKRRLQLSRHGRLGDAIITEASEDTLFYSYSIRGVQYTASQDVVTLRELLPVEPQRLIGIASLKYDTNNPANSILVCEEWSGLRTNTARVREAGSG